MESHHIKLHRRVSTEEHRLESSKQIARRVGLSIGAINRLMNDSELSSVRIGTNSLEFDFGRVIQW
jgi:hypothetical protein